MVKIVLAGVKVYVKTLPISFFKTDVMQGNILNFLPTIF